MSQIYGLSVHLDGPSGKLDPNGGFQLQFELVHCVPGQHVVFFRFSVYTIITVSSVSLVN